MCYPKPLDELQSVLTDGHTQCMGTKKTGEQCTKTSTRGSPRFRKAAAAIKATSNLDVTDPKNLPQFLDLAGTLICGRQAQATRKYPPQTWILIASWAPDTKHGRILRRGIREYSGPDSMEGNPAARFLASIEEPSTNTIVGSCSTKRTGKARSGRATRKDDDVALQAQPGRGDVEEKRTDRQRSRSLSTERARGTKTLVKVEDVPHEDVSASTPRVKLERRRASCPATSRQVSQKSIKKELKTEDDVLKIESPTSTRKKLAFDIAQIPPVAISIKSLPSEDVKRFPGRVVTRSVARKDGAVLYHLTDDGSPFSNFRTKKRSEEEVDRDLRKKLRKPLGKKDEKSGYVYMYRRRNFPGHVKIGITTRTVDIRMRELASRCGFDLELIYESHQRRIPNVQRAEALIHAQLALSRKWERCSGCGIRHKECVEISEHKALAVVEYWRSFMEARPYTIDGRSLKPQWVAYLDRLEGKQNCKGDISHKQGTQSWMDCVGVVKVEPSSD